jgi:hypothetical protein
VVLAVLLAATLACERTAPNELFAPTKTGLTLAFEDPSLPEPRRTQERLQVRIAKVEQEDKKMLVTKTFSSLKGQMDVLFAYENGGVTLMRDKITAALVVLPPQFPNVQAWEERGQRYRVEGRAALPETGFKLPDTMNHVGVWVVSESLDGKGPKRRSFFLPQLGEIETQEFQEGKWVSINRLFSYGFQDLPFDKKN